LGDADGAVLARREWTLQDAKSAGPFLDGLPENPRTFLKLIAAEGTLGETEVVKQLGLQNPKQITGLHGWVGRVAAAFGLKSPVKSEPDSKGGAIWSMDPEIAMLFKE
jgi:hypothetical protein